ncbi:MAG: HAD-IIA family hydrolase [Victivallales bacterium]|nr:HAD-IIA family hydrolase [Victivallales bacterium]
MKLQSDDIAAKLRRIRHVVLDMDGTIYSGSELFPTTLPFLEQLAADGIGYTFMTNNSSLSTFGYITKLQKMGIPVKSGQMLTSTLSVIAYLQKTRPKLAKIFVLGTASFKKELENAGFTVTFDEPDAVVLGFDTELEYKNLCKAAYWIRQGLPWFASHPDMECPTNQPTVLIDCGAITSCLAQVTGRVPDMVLGKPVREMLDPLIEKYHLCREQVLMVGDRMNTDMQLARNAGTMAVLIDVSQTADVSDDTVICSVRDLGELGELMRYVNNQETANGSFEHCPKNT